MKIDVKFVELHSPLFLCGKNLGPKIYSENNPDKRGAPGMKMYYDTDLRHLVIIDQKGNIAMVESAASMTLSQPEQIGFQSLRTWTAEEIMQVPNPIPTTAVKAQATGPERTIRTAQVSTPHDKVQGTPGRKARYQGEDAK